MGRTFPGSEKEPDQGTCNDGGLNSADAKCAWGTDCDDCGVRSGFPRSNGLPAAIPSIVDVCDDGCEIAVENVEQCLSSEPIFGTPDASWLAFAPLRALCNKCAATVSAVVSSCGITGGFELGQPIPASSWPKSKAGAKACSEDCARDFTEALACLKGTEQEKGVYYTTMSDAERASYDGFAQQCESDNAPTCFENWMAAEKAADASDANAQLKWSACIAANAKSANSTFASCAAGCQPALLSLREFCHVGADETQALMPATEIDSIEKVAKKMGCDFVDAKTHSWVPGTFGACSATCGGGKRVREVNCVSNLDGTVATTTVTNKMGKTITVLDQSKCTSPKPIESAICGATACIHYVYEPVRESADESYGKCTSKSDGESLHKCGPNGTQVVEYKCVRDTQSEACVCFGRATLSVCE